MDAAGPGGVPGRSGTHRRPAHVLVIDDEPLIVEIMAKLLSQAHRVDVASSAKEAIERLLGGERYDIIFCDVIMPGMTGLDLFDELARRLPAQARRVVFITGGITHPALRERLASTGAPVLEKPIEHRVLQQLASDSIDPRTPETAAIP